MIAVFCAAFPPIVTIMFLLDLEMFIHMAARKANT